MSDINVPCQPVNQTACNTMLAGFVQKLNGLGRYTASLNGTTITLARTATATEFFRVSASATAADSLQFIAFLSNNPPHQMVTQYRPHSAIPLQPAHPALVQQITKRLADSGEAFTQKLEFIRNVLEQVEPTAVGTVMGQAILPWFFRAYKKGRVIAVALTQQALDYELVRRNLLSLHDYGYEEVHADPNRRKPFNDLLISIDSRLTNAVKLVSQYNGPFLDAFCIAGIFSTFIFIPSESVHRRSLHTTGIFEVIAPFSSMSASPELYIEDGQADTVKKIHPKRGAAQIDEWIRYWLLQTNATFDRLYDFVRSDDGHGNVDFDKYMRGLLQFERILFEITWACSMLDQFMRKILVYGVLDKITAFMNAAVWSPGVANPMKQGTPKFLSALTSNFIVNRLPQLFRNPILQAHSATWLQRIYDDLMTKSTDHAYPASLISASQADLGRFPHLQPAVTRLFSGNPLVGEQEYFAQVIRAIRNTHHGFSDLFDAPFAMLTTTSGVVSEEIASLLPFFGFAMLEDADAALNGRW